ncbi:MAG: DUF5711 family protein [Clostridia bacterium]|nr:DUF5711 family protein [Clostridia bacterium]
MRRHKRLIGAAVLVFLAVVAAALYFAGGRPVITALFRDGAFGARIEMDTSFGYTAKKYDGGVLVLGKEGLCAVTNAGRKAWQISFPVTRPILDTGDRYAIAADRGSKTAILVASGRVKERIETDESIQTASVNRQGTFALVTEERGYKGRVKVYNNAGKEIYTWHSAAQDILSAAVSEDSKLLAVSVVNTEDLSKLCTVLLFRLDAKEPTVCDVGDENLVANLIFNGRELLAVGDESLYYFKGDGQQKFMLDYKGCDLQAYSFNKGGVLSLGFAGGAEGNRAEFYDTNGKKKGSCAVKGVIEDMDTFGRYTAINTAEGLLVVDSAGRVKTERDMEIAAQQIFLCGSRNRMFIISGVSAGMYIL